MISNFQKQIAETLVSYLGTGWKWIFQSLLRIVIKLKGVVRTARAGMQKEEECEKLWDAYEDKNSGQQHTNRFGRWQGPGQNYISRSA